MSRQTIQGSLPFALRASRYQRWPEAYSRSVGRKRDNERSGSVCAHATWIALIAAIGATYEFRIDGLTTGVIKYASQKRAIGEVLLSVIPNVGTPCLRACWTASTVSRKH